MNFINGVEDTISHPPFELRNRKALLLTDGRLGALGAKTADCFIRYRPDDTAVVLDRVHAGKTVQDVLGFGGAVPIVDGVERAASFAPDIAIVGVAPRGGGLSATLREDILRCLDADMDIVNGLHVLLGNDDEIRKSLRRSKSRIWDVRRAPDGKAVADGRGCVTGAKTVLLVGTDCGVGKMTVAYELYLEARRRGINAAWAATGQTGMILRGRGIAVDAVIGDYLSGAAETLVNFEGQAKDIVFVEGQGSLLHPGYGAVTLGLMLGVMPDCMVLVHDLAKKTVKDYDAIEIPSMRDMMQYHQAVMLPVKKVPFAAVAARTGALPLSSATEYLRDIEAETDLPAGDVIRFGCTEILDGVLACLHPPRRQEGDN
ncbi:MAG: DUF1611 domain-containing protein [Candidatus Latescibacterota bacterium]